MQRRLHGHPVFRLLLRTRLLPENEAQTSADLLHRRAEKSKVNPTNSPEWREGPEAVAVRPTVVFPCDVRYPTGGNITLLSRVLVFQNSNEFSR
jgi:hypothetical protein